MYNLTYSRYMTYTPFRCSKRHYQERHRRAFGWGSGIEGIRRSKKLKRSRRALTPEVEQQILDTTLKTRPANATHWSSGYWAQSWGVSPPARTKVVPVVLK